MATGIYVCDYGHWFEVKSGLPIPSPAQFYQRTGRCESCWCDWREDSPVHMKGRDE